MARMCARAFTYLAILTPKYNTPTIRTPRRAYMAVATLLLTRRNNVPRYPQSSHAAPRHNNCPQVRYNPENNMDNG